MFMGVVIALGPLAWVWLRSKDRAPARRLEALTLLTLFLTFDLVLFGAFTRLTDSGLGCPDWPGCYGSASPSGAQAQISQAAGGDAHRAGDARQGLDRDVAPLLRHRRRRADHDAGRGHLAGCASAALRSARGGRP